MMVVRILYLALLVPLVLLIAACNQTSSLSTTPKIPTTQFVVVGDLNGYPEGCDPRQVVSLIMQFFAAYNAGDQDQLAQLFPRTFEWYSDTRVEVASNRNEEMHFVTRPGNREDLLNYFAGRHQQNEQLTLQVLSVTAWRSAYVDIVWVYRRQADDIKPGPDGRTRVGDGKGVIACRTQKIFLWSMGTAAPYEDEADYQWPCTEEPESGEELLSAIVCLEYTEEQ